MIELGMIVIMTRKELSEQLRHYHKLGEHAGHCDGLLEGLEVGYKASYSAIKNRLNLSDEMMHEYGFEVIKED